MVLRVRDGDRLDAIVQITSLSTAETVRNQRRKGEEMFPVSLRTYPTEELILASG